MMYQNYWNMTRAPFESDLDADFYFAAGSHAAAALKLQYLIEQRKGAGVLAAPSGLGKTYLTHQLEKQLDSTTYPFFRLLYPRLDAAGLFAQIAIRLGVTPREVDSRTNGLDQIIERLRNRLAAICKGGREPVLVIDDAHLIESPEVWHGLRLLLNFRETDGIEFTLLLIGQPQMLGILRSFGDLYDRLAVRVSLSAFDHSEVTQYLEHRMSVAGTETHLFLPEAVEVLADLSAGIPRKINQLADLTLLVGYADKLDHISSAEMHAASAEMQVATVE